jgi:phage FluMu protein Com
VYTLRDQATTKAEIMQDVRCGKCNRKLGEIGRFEKLAIKCPRCKTINHYSGIVAGSKPQPLSATGRVEDSSHANQSGSQTLGA